MDITLERLNSIFSNAFQEEIILTENCSKETIDSWDSINHLNLMVEFESELNINLTPIEIEKMTSIKDIVEIINTK